MRHPIGWACVAGMAAAIAAAIWIDPRWVLVAFALYVPAALLEKDYPSGL